MADARRSTIYLEADLHRALRLKAAATDRSISDLVNDAVRAVLAEDAEDLAAFEDTAGEPTMVYEEFLEYLTSNGKL